MWGIIPAAGSGTRIQPLAFSKELLPVGSRAENGVERPRAVSEYLVDRMVLGGADKLCFIISPGKADILSHFGSGLKGTAISYVVQPRPHGLCDAIFRAVPFVHPDEDVLVGMPDTVWFPEDGFRALPNGELSFLLFPVDHPEFFDAVLFDNDGRVTGMQVKSPAPQSRWIWGAFKLSGRTLHGLHELWLERNRTDEYVGTLVNAWIATGGRPTAVRAGTSYVDVGTLHGYREALRALEGVPTAASTMPQEV